MENNHFKSWVWVKACRAWDEVTKWTGFDGVKIAYTQGYYAGYNNALKESDEEIEDLGGFTGSSFRHLFKRWSKYAYNNNIHSQAELESYESYLDIFEATLTQKSPNPKMDYYNDDFLFDLEEPLEHFLSFIELFANSAKAFQQNADKDTEVPE